MHNKSEPKCILLNVLSVRNIKKKKNHKMKKYHPVKHQNGYE